jgi:hypothetical protein
MGSPIEKAITILTKSEDFFGGPQTSREGNP